MFHGNTSLHSSIHSFIHSFTCSWPPLIQQEARDHLPIAFSINVTRPLSPSVPFPFPYTPFLPWFDPLSQHAFATTRPTDIDQKQQKHHLGNSPKTICIHHAPPSHSHCHSNPSININISIPTEPNIQPASRSSASSDLDGRARRTVTVCKEAVGRGAEEVE